MAKNYHDQGARAPAVVLLTVTWALFGIATLFFASRIVVRIKFQKRIFIDDGWALFALICLLTNAIIMHIFAPQMYTTLQLQQFQTHIKRQSNIMEDVSAFLKFQFAQTMVFWTCLWSVKFSFMAFFKRLTNNLKAHIIAWWIIVVITALAYIGCVITYPISCPSFSPLVCTKPDNVRLSLVSLRYSTAVDILTDAMIMALPITLAWRVKLPLRTRIALISVFSFGFIIIAFAILRIIFTNSSTSQPEISWLALWSAIEATVAVVVCNLAPFKVLFHGRVRHYTTDPYQGYRARYGKAEDNEKQGSHELSTSGRSQQRMFTAREKLGTIDTMNSTASSYYAPLPVQYPDRAASRSRPSYNTQPRRPRAQMLRTNITADPELAEQHAGMYSGAIMVTREVNRQEKSADQVTMTMEEQNEHEKLRTMWSDRSSTESMEEILPNRPRHLQKGYVKRNSVGIAR